MRTRFLIVGLAATAALSFPATATLPTPGDAAAQREAQAFLFKASASDIFEIVTSMMAVQKSTNPAVRAFATMLIAEHSDATNRSLATAVAAGLMPPPPELSPMQKNMVGQLMAATPATFDRVYLTQQVPAHEQALALVRAYSTQGDVPALRANASQLVPVVSAHLTEARTLLRATR